MSACNAGDLGSIPGLGRSPGEGNGNPLQYSCLENPMDRGARQATVHGVTKTPSRDLPNPGIQRVSLMSPELAGRFFTPAPPGNLVALNI